MTANETMVLDRTALEALPRTALGAIGPTARLLPVTATCTAVEAIEDQLCLFAYRVDAPQPDSIAAALKAAVVPSEQRSGLTPASPRRRGEGGARAEILDAIRASVTEPATGGLRRAGAR